jgi:SAM-dependent methyltransferase
MTGTGTAAARWRELQEARGIPPEILAQAPASPWRHDPKHFVAPAEPADAPSRDAALALLRTAASQRTGKHDDVRTVRNVTGWAARADQDDARPVPGPAEWPARADQDDARTAPDAAQRLARADEGGDVTVLDVGCGGGSASLAVADHADLLVGVDHHPGMLEVFAADCAARGVRYRTVLGEWPDVAKEAGRADAVLCHHVGYNTVDFPPFLTALTEAARVGVVMELTAQHPMAWLDPLWVRFHGLHRPPPATADDAVAVLRELGIEPTVTRWRRPPRLPEDPAWVARRLCLPPERVPEVAEALAETPPRPRDTVTLTWAGSA